jgi:hypothetical protein
VPAPASPAEPAPPADLSAAEIEIEGADPDRLDRLETELLALRDEVTKLRDALGG